LNKSNLISNIFLFFSILILAYIFYRSEIIYDGNKRNHYLIYYFLAISSLIFSIISFSFISERIKINISIVVISTYIALIFIETFFVFY